MPEEINIQNKNSEESISKTEVENTSPEETTPPPPATETEEPGPLTEKHLSAQPQSTVMEVHKHPHHVLHKKKWGEYLLEFFMLFLAVFLGFIAENLRENYVEHRRAKEYTQSLYNDLKKDSSWLNYLLDLKQWRSKKLDSLLLLISDADVQKHARELYYYNCFLTTDLQFKPNDVTVQQLRSSGALRYFSNVQMYNTITGYYNDCNFYMERENESRQMIPSFSLTSKIFNTGQLMSMIEDPPPFDMKKAIHRPAANEEFTLLKADDQTWNEYALFVQKQKGRNGLSILILQGLVAKAQKELMTALRKEYHVN